MPLWSDLCCWGEEAVYPVLEEGGAGPGLLPQPAGGGHHLNTDTGVQGGQSRSTAGQTCAGDRNLCTSPGPAGPGISTCLTCAVCSVKCRVCSVQCAECSVQCAVCSVQCAVCCAHVHMCVSVTSSLSIFSTMRSSCSCLRVLATSRAGHRNRPRDHIWHSGLEGWRL